MGAEADAFYGYGYGLPYAHGVAYAGVPFGSSTGLDPITQGLDPVTQGALPVAHYYGKRSADADAAVVAAVPFGDPSGLDPITQGLDVSTQGYLPYAHGFYGRHLGYYGHYYGKRSADAEADPYYLGGYAVAGLPVGHPSGLDPITQGLDASTQGHFPYAYGHLGYYGHHLGYLGHYYG